MGVKIHKRGGKWYIFLNYHGRRKAKCVGSSREVAEQVRRQLEAKLALGDLGFLVEKQETTFGNYAEKWKKQYADVKCKPSTARRYKSLLDVHILPRFKTFALSDITRDSVKAFFADLASKERARKKTENSEAEKAMKLSANSLQNARSVCEWY